MFQSSKNDFTLIMNAVVSVLYVLMSCLKPGEFSLLFCKNLNLALSARFRIQQAPEDRRKLTS